MKNITAIFLFILLGSECLYAGKIDVRAAGAAGKQVTLLGYEGMKEIVLSTFTLDSKGYGSYEGTYQGFLLMEIKDIGVFPLLHNKTSTVIVLDMGAAMPHFPGDDENTSFYKVLSKKQKFSNQINAIGESLQFFGDKDSLYEVILEKQTKIYDSIAALSLGLRADTVSLYARILWGKELIENTWNTRNKEQLADRKSAMLEFLKKNARNLYHTDILRQMAFQYTMMNEYVAVGRENDRWVLDDIDTWINELGGALGKNEIAGFFVNMYVGRRMISQGIEMLNRFPEYTTCETGLSVKPAKNQMIDDISVEKWKSDFPSTFLSKIDSSKIRILAFFSSDCAACIPSNKDLANRLTFEEITTPVITVFSGTQSPFLLPESALPRNITWFYDDTSEGDGLNLCRKFGIDRFPAYIVMDNDLKAILMVNHAGQVIEFVKQEIERRGK